MKRWIHATTLIGCYTIGEIAESIADLAPMLADELLNEDFGFFVDREHISMKEFTNYLKWKSDRISEIDFDSEEDRREWINDIVAESVFG